MKKKLSLLTGVLLSTSLWASPMDEICSLKGNAFGEFDKEAWNRLENSCMRNNILEVTNISRKTLLFVINSYCRFDRNVYTGKRFRISKDNVSSVDDSRVDLGCVLYAPEGRARG